MHPLKALFLAARPKTWSASICPVLLGTAFAANDRLISLSNFLYTLSFALCMQIGANYSNDVFDYLKGVDTQLRSGPKRAVQQGWIRPRSMLYATTALFFSAFLFAFPLMIQIGVWSFCFALLCIFFAIFYAGGPKPLSHIALGEVLVFIFFGPAAVTGTYFAQTHHIHPQILLASLSPGFLSASLMLVNNLRDECSDKYSGKQTIIVHFGQTVGKILYILSICGAGTFSALAAIWLGCSWIEIISFLCPLLLAPFAAILSSDFNKALPQTSFILVLHTVLFCYAVKEI